MLSHEVLQMTMNPAWTSDQSGKHMVKDSRGRLIVVDSKNRLDATPCGYQWTIFAVLAGKERRNSQPRVCFTR